MKKLSSLQELVWSDNFHPKCPKALHNGTTIWMDNENCEEFLRVKGEYGEAISNEISRAWIDIQKFSHLSRGNRIPWNTLEYRRMEVAEIILFLALRSFH